VLVAVVHRECDPLRLVQLLRLREEEERQPLQQVRHRLDVFERRLDVHREVPLRELLADTLERRLKIRPNPLRHRGLVQPVGVEPEFREVV
jgi:hypothetical protein